MNAVVTLCLRTPRARNLPRGDGIESPSQKLRSAVSIDLPKEGYLLGSAGEVKGVICDRECAGRRASCRRREHDRDIAEFGRFRLGNRSHAG